MVMLAKEIFYTMGKCAGLALAAVLFFQTPTLCADSDTTLSASAMKPVADAAIPDTASTVSTVSTASTGTTDTTMSADSATLVAPTGATDSDTAASAPAPVPAAVTPPAEPAPLKNEIPKDKMPEIKVIVSPEKGAIGDLIEWKVAVQKKAAADRVVLPSSFNFGSLEIQSRTLAGEKDDETAMTQTLGVGLISFETGEFEIPPQKLTVVDADGNLSELMSPAFKVTITSLIANEPEPAVKLDEEGGEVVMVEDYTLLYVAIGLGAVLVIVLLTLLVRKLLSMRKPKPGPPPPPPRPAHEVALEKLNAIKNAGYLDEQMHKTFHLKLSEAFREYLGNRYKFDALEMSTREIVAQLRARALKLELHREVVQLLEDTDLVKFAKYIPAKESSEQLLDEAFRIVEVTRTPMASASSGGEADVDKADGGLP